MQCNMEPSKKEEFTYTETQYSKLRPSTSNEQLFYQQPEVHQTPPQIKTEVFNTGEAGRSPEGNECPGCLTSFVTCEELQKHIITNIDPLQPGALRCNLAYQHVFKGEADVRLSPTKPFQCQECTWSFKTRGEVRSHMLIHTEVKPYKCGACIAEFKRKTELRRHELVHLNLFPYKCTECVKSYRTRGELKSHFLIHSNYRQFKCGECSLEFKRRAELNRHRTSHQTPSSAACARCRNFTNPRELKLHLMSAHGVRLFKCRCCPAEFVREGDLKEHAAIHANTSGDCSVCRGKIDDISRIQGDPLVCLRCSKASLQLPPKLQHGSPAFNEDRDQIALAPSEETEGTFACGDCDKLFRSKAQLSSHRITHSPVKAYRCLECGAEYRRKAELHRHALVHLQISPFFCTYCAARFRTKGELKSHLLVHSDIRPYKCLKCRCQYKRKTELKNHQAKCSDSATSAKSYQVVSKMMKISNQLQNMSSASSSLQSPSMFEPAQWYQPCISLNAVFSHSYRYGFV